MYIHFNILDSHRTYAFLIEKYESIYNKNLELLCKAPKSPTGEHVRAKFILDVL